MSNLCPLVVINNTDNIFTFTTASAGHVFKWLIVFLNFLECVSEHDKNDKTHTEIINLSNANYVFAFYFG